MTSDQAFLLLKPGARQRDHPTAADDLLQHYGIAVPWYGKVLGTGLAYRANPKYLQKLPVDVTLYKGVEAASLGPLANLNPLNKPLKPFTRAAVQAMQLEPGVLQLDKASLGDPVDMAELLDPPLPPRAVEAKARLAAAAAAQPPAPAAVSAQPPSAAAGAPEQTALAGGEHGKKKKDKKEKKHKKEKKRKRSETPSEAPMTGMQVSTKQPQILPP